MLAPVTRSDVPTRSEVIPERPPHTRSVVLPPLGGTAERPPGNGARLAAIEARNDRGPGSRGPCPQLPPPRWQLARNGGAPAHHLQGFTSSVPLWPRSRGSWGDPQPPLSPLALRHSTQLQPSATSQREAYAFGWPAIIDSTGPGVAMRPAAGLASRWGHHVVSRCGAGSGRRGGRLRPFPGSPPPSEPPTREQPPDGLSGPNAMTTDQLFRLHRLWLEVPSAERCTLLRRPGLIAEVLPRAAALAESGRAWADAVKVATAEVSA